MRQDDFAGEDALVSNALENGKAEKVGVCPKCGGETRVAHYDADQTSAQCETYVEMCLDCDWQGEPE